MYLIPYKKEMAKTQPQSQSYQPYACISDPTYN